jgi:type IV pilus assembly protein PilC
MHNLVYRNAVHELYLHISAGKQLHLAVQRCKLFPPMMVHMIQIGEESGTLETMLTKIADFYEADLDQMISYLSKMLEPLIMVILGVVIGGLVIAMYLPIFKLGDVI